MNTKDNKSEAQQIKELLAHWMRYWYVFVISFVVCAVIGAMYYKASVRIWGTHASVSLRSSDPLSGGISQAKSLMSSFGLGGGGKDNIEDESLRMGSQSHMREVVRNLGLNTEYRYDTFLGLVDHNLYDKSPIVIMEAPDADTLSVVIRFIVDLEKDKTKFSMKADKYTVGKYETSSFPFTIETAWGTYVFDKSEYYDQHKKPMEMKIFYTSYDYMAQMYRKAIGIDFQKKTSNIINLSIEGDNKPFCKEVLNEVIAVYNKINDAEKNLVTRKTIEFIDQRLHQTEKSLASADTLIQRFKSSNNLTAIEADVTYYFTIAGEVQAQLLAAESQLKIIEITTDFVQDEDNKYLPIPYNASFTDPSLVAALAEYNKQLIARNEAVQSGVIYSFENQLNSQRKILTSSLKNAKKASEIALSGLKEKEKEFNKKLGSVPGIERDYIALMREQEIQQTIYIFLLQMKEETGVKGVSILPKLQIVDSPYVLNEKTAPNLMKFGIMIVLLGGIIIPISLVYLMPYIKRVFRKKNNA